MKTLRVGGFVLIVAVVSSGATYLLAAGSQEPPAAASKPVSERVASHKKALLDNARLVNELIFKWHNEGGPISFEDLYRWSNRLLEAELDVAKGPAGRAAALKGHMERMKYAEDQAMEQAKKGAGRVSDRAACRYYRDQAELWLAIEESKPR